MPAPPRPVARLRPFPRAGPSPSHVAAGRPGKAVAKRLVETNGCNRGVDLVVANGDVYDPLILTAAQACSAARVFAATGNHDLPSAFPVPIVDLQSWGCSAVW